MSNSVSQQISLFRSYILNRRLDNETLRILESVSVSKDVNSLMQVHSSLREFTRSESVSIIREIVEKPVDQKLLVLEFLVRAFALIGDVESCLALRYEGLLLRDLKSATYRWLQVSYVEWLSFAEQTLDKGFYSIAGKACENALLCLERDSRADPKTFEFFESVQVTEKIKRLKDCAITSLASFSGILVCEREKIETLVCCHKLRILGRVSFRSSIRGKNLDLYLLLEVQVRQDTYTFLVQARAAEYLKSKQMDRSSVPCSASKGIQHVASTLFRIGIKQRNVRKLYEIQSLPRMTDEPTLLKFN